MDPETGQIILPTHPNSKLYVLNALFRWNAKQQSPDPTTLETTALYKEHTSRGCRIGNPLAVYNSGPILHAISLLEDAELVTTNSERDYAHDERGRLSGATTKTEVSLTPQAEAYLTEMHRGRYLPEALRKLLLGERDVGDTGEGMAEAAD